MAALHQERWCDDVAGMADFPLIAEEFLNLRHRGFVPAVDYPEPT